MIINLDKICYDLLVIPIENGRLDISWSLNTDIIRDELIKNDINKIFDFHDKVDFVIQIDNKNTFDTINFKQFYFSNIEQKYIGNIVFSAIIDFNKNQFEETEYYIRIKLLDKDNSFLVKTSTSDSTYEQIQFNNDWSDTLKFVIPKDFTKDLTESMYTMVADFNAYNKEVKSANFYYLFQAFADTLNKQNNFVVQLKNSNFINKSIPDFLYDTFGVLYKFTNIQGLNMEEYRRIIKNLIIGYEHGGAWNYIKQVLKYLIGYTPELLTFKKFYPWILRKQSLNDPSSFKDRNYYNPASNYYLFKSDFSNAKNRNKIMLVNDNFRKFTFIVKSDNFFNRQIDESKIKDILNILKPAYTKYLLNLNVDSFIDMKALLADNENALLADDNEYLMY